MISVSHRSAFTLIKLPLLGSDEVNHDLDMFTDQLLPQELSNFVSVVSLLRVGLSRGWIKANPDNINKTQK